MLISDIQLGNTLAHRRCLLHAVCGRAAPSTPLLFSTQKRSAIACGRALFSLSQLKAVVCAERHRGETDILQLCNGVVSSSAPFQ